MHSDPLLVSQPYVLRELVVPDKNNIAVSGYLYQKFQSFLEIVMRVSIYWDNILHHILWDQIMELEASEWTACDISDFQGLCCTIGFARSQEFPKIIFSCYPGERLYEHRSRCSSPSGHSRGCNSAQNIGSRGSLHLHGGGE